MKVSSNLDLRQAFGPLCLGLIQLDKMCWACADYGPKGVVRQSNLAGLSYAMGVVNY